MMIHKNAIEGIKFAFHPHMRHKTLFILAYSVHMTLEHIAPESAGSFYFIVEIFHVFLG